MTVSDPSLSSRVVAIHGVGLLGGSIAAAVKARGLARRLIGLGRNADRLQAAVDRGLIDAFVTDLAQADPVWDFVIVATPVDRIPDDVRDIAAISRPGTVITDVGSVKAPIVRELSQLNRAGVAFVGSHPLAGSEKRGFEAAHASLFEKRVVVMTPDEFSVPEAVRLTRVFWESLGARVIVMEAEAHDRALATTSHLPHVAASALAIGLEDSQRALAATGFRDTTRIASGDPDLWVSILMANADAVVRSLTGHIATLRDFEATLRDRDESHLRELLATGKRNRDAFHS